ncbi:MAG: hypothetical protein KF715_07005 [Candidatus Didemnitutus sp.]|nr:hypothetical protein [Candidatus Didemnitutus sp.]
MNRPFCSPRIWWQALLLAAATWLAVMAVFGRWTWADWSAPHWLEGDPLEVYARVKIAAEQPRHALASFSDPARLGAPYVADWRAYTVPDRIVFVLTGLLSRSFGLVAAVQLVSALGFVLNAVSFFLCARWLGRRWEWAAAAALGFAFCNYNLRWGITLSLAQTFTLPPLVLLCAYAARPAPVRRRLPWLALGAALGCWLALGNPYLAFFAGVVASGGGVLALLRRAPRSRVAPLAVFLVTLALVFIAANFHYARAHWGAAETSSLARDPSDFQRYALRPLEWFVPPADHRLSALAALGRAYQANSSAGEFFYAYLGVLGGAGLVGLVLLSLHRARRFPLRQAALGGLLWIVAFGLPYGVNSWLGHAGLDVFRASTRIAIFAAVWVAFFLAAIASRLTHRWPRGLSVAAASILAGFMIWEQTPSLSARTARQANVARLDAQQELMARLEAELPRGAMIFQLPVAPFPEAGRIAALPDYEHFLPFLFSTELHFSYGHLGSAAALRWERSIAHLPPRKMVGELQQTGFAALWIDRRGFADEAVALVRELQMAKLPEIAVPAGLPVNIFRLRPVPRPTLPDPTMPFFYEPWGVTETDDPPVRALAVDGWYPPEREGDRAWRWASQRAILGLWNTDVARQKVRVTFVPIGRPPARLQLHSGGRTLWEGAFADVSNKPQSVDLVLTPELNRLTWKLDGKTFVPGRNDRRRLGFALENLSVELK